MLQCKEKDILFIKNNGRQLPLYWVFPAHSYAEASANVCPYFGAAKKPKTGVEGKQVDLPSKTD
jgi:hypothetical protein